MLVLFRVGTISVAIFKIDAEILNRLATQFFKHAGVNRLGQPRGPIFMPQLFRKFGEAPLRLSGFLGGFWQSFGPR